MQDPERYLFFRTGQKLSAQKNGKGRVTVPVFLFFEFYRNWEVRATRSSNFNRASSKQLYLGLAIVTIAAAAQANAGRSNPLHPSFYWGAAPDVQAATSGAKQYVDSRNPLHPAYPRIVNDSGWQSAVGSMGPGYRDSNNPLQPSFKR